MNIGGASGAKMKKNIGRLQKVKFDNVVAA